MRALSSGQQVRLAVALALARRPRLLLCDEPTNHLDHVGLSWLETAIRHAVESGAVGAAVVVSHDRTFLEEACTHTLDATGGGGALYSGGYKTYVRRKLLREGCAVGDGHLIAMRWPPNCHVMAT